MRSVLHLRYERLGRLMTMQLSEPCHHWMMSWSCHAHPPTHLVVHRCPSIRFQAFHKVFVELKISGVWKDSGRGERCLANSFDASIARKQATKTSSFYPSRRRNRRFTRRDERKQRIKLNALTLLWNSTLSRTGIAAGARRCHHFD